MIESFRQFNEGMLKNTCIFDFAIKWINTATA